MSEEALPPISKEVVKKVRENLNLDEKRLTDALEGLKDWLELQPHLPKEIDDDRLERWLIRCKNNMEKTKQTLDMYYTLRTLAPEIMCGWDVNEPWFEISCNSCYYCPMPNLTKDMDRITLSGFLEGQHEFDFIGNLKVILQILEIRMSEDYNLRDIYVADLKHLTLADCQKISLPVLKKMEVCAMRGYNTRLGAIHFLNTPGYAQFIVNFLKSILKSKITQRIHVYGSDLTEFYKQVPKEFLPNEYGGTAGSVKEYWGRWQKKLRSNREWLLSRENVKTDESKRPANKINDSELFGFEGSFRKLSID